MFEKCEANFLFFFFSFFPTLSTPFWMARSFVVVVVISNAICFTYFSKFLSSSFTTLHHTSNTGIVATPDVNNNITLRNKFKFISNDIIRNNIGNYDKYATDKAHHIINRHWSGSHSAPTSPLTDINHEANGLWTCPKSVRRGDIFWIWNWETQVCWYMINFKWILIKRSN